MTPISLFQLLFYRCFFPFFLCYFGTAFNDQFSIFDPIFSGFFWQHENKKVPKCFSCCRHRSAVIWNGIRSQQSLFIPIDKKNLWMDLFLRLFFRNMGLFSGTWEQVCKAEKSIWFMSLCLWSIDLFFFKLSHIQIFSCRLHDFDLFVMPFGWPGTEANHKEYGDMEGLSRPHYIHFTFWGKVFLYVAFTYIPITGKIWSK